MTRVKGHDSMSYKILLVISGILFKFTIVKISGPNKSLKPRSFVTFGSYFFLSLLETTFSYDILKPNLKAV